MAQAVSFLVYSVKDVVKARSVFDTFLGAAIGDQGIGLDPHGHSKRVIGPIATVKDPDGNVIGLRGAK